MVGKLVALPGGMLSLLLSALLAQATPEVDHVAPLVTADGDRYDDHGRKVKDPANWGFAFDVGVPDGAGASLLVLPADWIAFHIAALHNGAGVGMRFGVQLIAFPSWRLLRPHLAFDVGSYSDGDASALAQLADPVVRPILGAALSRVSYQFANAHAGFEFGFKSATFFVRGGVSRIDGTLTGASAAAGTTTIKANGVHLAAFVPSARLGLMFCF